ncbi:hypothetical protein CHCC15290_2906 [Bacillus licheniformis]|nr:hypothetical protein AB684_04390 [Bacillus licheniformis]APJ26103.1 hypothetical protein BSZ43_04450 [Bacillus sp. H15-1]ASV14452.1 hypothetical protein CJO35_04475 [Bacillus sp. 1s-1]EQM29334.1 hypothetical protein N399_04570 [Bacillus licheniformis CG-B52]KUL08288.1 hypothetical protein LI17339_18640 [Bacillus licheniformis LMG 17339]MBY8349417.1 hypothetical protein [Bacillus sp. PCH94]NBB46084.1 hypothetical protein [Bacillus sp. y1(2019)]
MSSGENRIWLRRRPFSHDSFTFPFRKTATCFLPPEGELFCSCSALSASGGKSFLLSQFVNRTI